MEDLFKKVANDYEKTKNMRQTAINLNVSEAKVKKILITLGLYKTPLSLRISRLVAMGFKNTKAIAENLGISQKLVSANMPYIKTVYNGDNPTENALKIRATRERQKQQQQNQ